jgi:hypothetical protein
MQMTKTPGSRYQWFRHWSERALLWPTVAATSAASTAESSAISSAAPAQTCSDSRDGLVKQARLQHSAQGIANDDRIGGE